MTIELRNYQSECQQRTFDDFAEGYQRVINVLPTGSGKTTIFGSICSEYTRAFPDQRILVVSHLSLLVSQTAGRFKDEWGLEVGVLQGDRYPRSGDQVVITTMQSSREESKLLRWAANEGAFTPDKKRLNIGLIIVDECQYFGSKSYQKIIEHFPDAKVIGFTATPFRQNKLMSNLFEKTSYTRSLQDMIDEGYLVPPALNLTAFDVLDPASMYALMIQIYKEKHLGQKSVIFLKTIEEAKECAMVFKTAGIEASAITSELIGEGRDKILSDFRIGGGPDVLTTVDVLTAGFDSPNLQSIFIPYRVGSVTTYLQRVGRGLRPYKDKKHCDIYCGANSPGIEEGFWEDLNDKILKGGRGSIDDYDDLYDIIEHAKELMSEERYEWTISVVEMAKEAKRKGLVNLHDMIVHQDFPQEMLDVFIKHPPMVSRKNSAVPATKNQKYYLRKAGIKESMVKKVTKQEASAMIMAHKRANGWTPPKDEVVPAGKHEGKHWSEVPPAYIFWVTKNRPASEVAVAYKDYKNKWRK